MPHQKSLHAAFYAGLIVFNLAIAIPALADSPRITFTEENDSLLTSDDRHYTQGLKFAYLSHAVTPGGDWDRPYQWFSGTPIFENDGAAKRKYDWTIIGQSIFTPTDIHTRNPPLTDRPYAGWLYTGVGLLQDTETPTHHRLENLELLAGVVGPWSLAAEAQNDWHQFIGVRTANGWGHQLKDEPGFVLSYERKWRFEQPLLGNIGVDAIPELGASGGNIFTYGEAGGLLRFGQNLAADYGPSHIRPSLSGTSWFDKDQMIGDLGWYFFLGAQGRAVGHNIFLDGNTFASSPSVSKLPFVGDLMGGASLFWSDLAKIDFTFMARGKEFRGQAGHADNFTSVDLTVRF